MSKIRRVFGNIIGNSIKNMDSVKKEIIVNFEDLVEKLPDLVYQYARVQLKAMVVRFGLKIIILVVLQ